jgi:farnesyl diphosphate synthase
MFDLLNDNMQYIADQLYQKLDAILPIAEGSREDKLFEAMRYCTLSGGKRIRPFLCVVTASLFGVSLECALQTAAAIELIHSYSLIHDDLPALDNDDYRRGQPSCHKQYGEATAILTGDALLTLAFETLSHPSTHLDAAVRIELVNCIAKAIGYSGMVGGQMLDLLSEHASMDYTEVVRLQRMKTGALFVISCEAGAILGKASRNLRNALRAYANNVGLAFQITDDFLDAQGTREATGKKEQREVVIDRATLISSIGLDKAREQAIMLADQAVEHLKGFDRRAEPLRSLAQYVVRRSS